MQVSGTSALASLLKPGGSVHLRIQSMGLIMWRDLDVIEEEEKEEEGMLIKGIFWCF